MKSFEKLDTWKLCHALVLTTWRATKPLLDTERELAHRLRYVAEASYILDLLRVMDTIPEPTWQELDGLRGRASFYVNKLLRDSYALPDDLRDPLEDLEKLDWDEPEDWQK